MGLRIGTTKIRNVTTTDLDNRPPVIYNEWQRPSEWIDLPTIGESEEILVGLYAVDSTNRNNYLALNAQGDYTVDWGDGTVEDYSSGVKAEHIYDFGAIDPNTEYVTEEGFTYRQVLVKITPQAGSDLTYIDLQERHSYVTQKNDQQYDVRFLEIIINAPNLTSANGIGGGVVLLTYCKHLKISGITTGLTTIANLCYGMQALEKVEIEGNTSNVSDFSSMFQGCYELEYIPDFAMGRASGASSRAMFHTCFRLTRLPSTLSSLVSTRTDNMFYNCRSLRSIPKFETTDNCTLMYRTFYGCEALKAVPHIDTSNATNIYDFLYNCYSLERCPPFDTSNAVNMGNFFAGCRTLTTVPKLDTSQNTQFIGFYSACSTLKSVPQIDTSAGTNLSSMYSGCTQLESIPYMDTSANERFENMFNGCSSLRTVPLLDLSSCKSILRMFGSCFNLQDLPDIDTGPMVINGALNNSSWREVFYNCFSLKKIPASFLNGLSVGVELYRTFRSCTQLRSLPSTFIDNFNANDDVYNVFEMFRECTSLKEIPGVMDLSTITSANNQSNLFYGCRSLEEAKTSGAKYTLSYYNCFLGKAQIVEIFNSLENVSNATIELRLNPGLADLTEDDRLIATNKGWTINSN